MSCVVFEERFCSVRIMASLTLIGLLVALTPQPFFTDSTHMAGLTILVSKRRLLHDAQELLLRHGSIMPDKYDCFKDASIQTTGKRKPTNIEYRYTHKAQ